MNVSPCSHHQSSCTDGARSRLGGIGGANYVVRIKNVSDGTAQTIAVDELRAGLNEQDLRGSWAMPGLANGSSALFNDAYQPNPCGGNSDDMENCAATGLAGHADQCMGCFASNGTGQMAPRSMHDEGVHVLMVDGSARFVSDSIDSKPTDNGCGTGPHGVWQALHTRAGGEIVDGF